MRHAPSAPTNFVVWNRGGQLLIHATSALYQFKGFRASNVRKLSLSTDLRYCPYSTVNNNVIIH